MAEVDDEHPFVVVKVEQRKRRIEVTARSAGDAITKAQAAPAEAWSAEPFDCVEVSASRVKRS